MKATASSPRHGQHAARAPRGAARSIALTTQLACWLSLAGCNTPPSIVQGPLSVPPVMPPSYLERTNPGSLFQPDAPVASLFSGQKLARQVGDKLKVDIAECFKGDGNTEQSNKFTGQIAVQVINVLPNGHLVIAGERAVAFNRGVTRMRFSGVVSPSDIRAGNLVASSDVVNARLETAGEGDISEAASRSWLQGVLTKTLTVW